MRTITLFLLLCTLCVSTFAKDMNIRVRMDYVYGDYRVYERFFKTFQNAINSANVDMVAKMVEFPLKVHNVDGTHLIETQKDFVAQYEQIINNDVYNEVIQQNFEELFVHQTGIMIGRGQVWFSGKCLEPGASLDDNCKRVWVRVTSISHKAPRSFE